MSDRNDAATTPAAVPLSTERLALHAPVAADALALLAYFDRNRARLERWEPPRPRDASEVARWIDSQGARARPYGGVSSFVARDRTSGAIVGEVHLDGFSSEPLRSAMIAYAVDAAYEGRGYASEAVGAVVAYAFATLHLDEIVAYYDPENARSERLLRRAGFHLVPPMPAVPGLERLMRSRASAVLRRPSIAG